MIDLELKVINGVLWTNMSCENPDDMIDKNVRDLKPEDLSKVNVSSLQCMQLMLYCALEADRNCALNWFKCYKRRYNEYKKSMVFHEVDKGYDRMKEDFTQLKKLSKKLRKDVREDKK